MLAARNAPAVLLIAPTGGGKTLAGFLPTLAELAATPAPGLHTLYISPLKALAVDIRRKLTGPVAEMGLPVRIEDRTGDTSAHKVAVTGEGRKRLVARGSGALWWPARRLLAVADLHFGKAGRLARRGGALLPPQDTQATPARLDAEVSALDPAEVVCLGDSFDDLEAADLPETEAKWLVRLMAGRAWVWVAGNHDPGPVALAGSHRSKLMRAPLLFRHIARQAEGPGEVSGHFYPKARLGGAARPCFLIDRARVILPAFGAYTGRLWATDPALAGLMRPGALAVLTGARALATPMLR